jgi:hypothetical protein
MAPEGQLDAEELPQITHSDAPAFPAHFSTPALRSGINFMSASSPPASSVPALHPVGICPFHDGIATLDLLLAELDPRETALFDATLDLRSLAAGTDAAACAAQLFRVRALLDGRHYLAFYRVRCWARRALRVEVVARRGGPAVIREIPLGCARLDEAVNLALAAVAHDGEVPAGAHVRFAFVAGA